MHRARASVPPDAIRIEDEVWQEAFRETTRSRARPRLRSLDGGRAARPRPVAAPTRRPVTAPGPRPRPELEASPAEVAEPRPSARPKAEPPARRTVTITGRGAERNLPWPTDAARRRSATRLHERAGFRPDRVAMWAVFLGMLLVLVAAMSAHA